MELTYSFSSQFVVTTLRFRLHWRRASFVIIILYSFRVLLGLGNSLAASAVGKVLFQVGLGALLLLLFVDLGAFQFQRTTASDGDVVVRGHPLGLTNERGFRGF